jgi:hypothetical protein
MSDIQRYPSGTPVANMGQLAYNANGKAFKQIPVLSMPYQIIANASAAGVLVGRGTLLRVQGATNGYIQFGADDIDAVDGTEATSLKTPNDFFLVVATDNYVRTSGAFRIELIRD